MPLLRSPLASQLNQSPSSYDPYGASYNPQAFGNQPFFIPGPGFSATGQPVQSGVGAGGGTVPYTGQPPDYGTPAYNMWQQNTPYSLASQQFSGQGQLEEQRWSRIMEFLKSLGILTPGMGLSQGLQQFSGQTAALRTEPAIRSYERAKSDVANRMASRGMGLSSAADTAYGQAYGDLSRALAETGTLGDVSAQGLQYSLLGDILRSAVRG